MTDQPTETGFLFSDPYVRALQPPPGKPRGVKSRTMRPITPYNSTLDGYGVGHKGPMRQMWDELLFDQAHDNHGFASEGTTYLSVPHSNGDTVHRVRPRVEAQDWIWVRECWDRDDYGLYYRADYERLKTGWWRTGSLHRVEEYRRGWRPSIHMKRGSCRYRMQVDTVFPQHPEDVTNGQALAEGVEFAAPELLKKEGVTPAAALRLLLNGIYAEKHGDNPLCWAWSWSEVEVLVAP